MTAIIFTAADFDKAINLTLNGLGVAGRPDGLSAIERASIIQHLRNQGVDAQLRQWMIENPARLTDGITVPVY
jgi:uncharacterized membrane protein YebE (DUF533 family)